MQVCVWVGWLARWPRHFSCVPCRHYRAPRPDFVNRLWPALLLQLTYIPTCNCALCDHLTPPNQHTAGMGMNLPLSLFLDLIRLSRRRVKALVGGGRLSAEPAALLQQQQQQQQMQLQMQEAQRRQQEGLYTPLLQYDQWDDEVRYAMPRCAVVCCGVLCFVLLPGWLHAHCVVRVSAPDSCRVCCQSSHRVSHPYCRCPIYVYATPCSCLLSRIPPC